MKVKISSSAFDLIQREFQDARVRFVKISLLLANYVTKVTSLANVKA